MKTLSILSLLLLLAGCQTSPSRPDRKIYVIIDDAGQHYSRDSAFFDLDAPLTIAVLPDCTYTKDVSRIAHETRANKELILHQPMEPLSRGANPGSGAIWIDTPSEEVAGILKKNMAQMPGAKGMNNHMGSKVTQDRMLMSAVMAFCKENDLFFIDSLTIPSSVAGKIARDAGIPTASCNLFLDNERDEDSIRAQFEKGMDIASRRGFVVMIGHTWSPNTAKVIREMYPEAREKGYTFHTISDFF